MGNATEIRDKSVLPLTGTEIYSLSGLWYVASAFDITQPPYYEDKGCHCTHYNMTIHSNYEEDNFYQTRCPPPSSDYEVPFKGRFLPDLAGGWYELEAYNASDFVGIIDYEVVT